MEEKTVLQTLIEIDQGINKEYVSSKGFKFVKDLIAKKHRKELKKAIDDYCNTNMVFSDELEYYIRCVADIHGSNYNHCRKIEIDTDGNLIAVFQADIHDTDAKVAAIFTLKNKSMDIRYSLFNRVGAREFGFTDSGVESLTNRKRHTRMVYPWPISDQPDCSKDLIAEVIEEDIKTFLDEMIARSERINANE